MKGSLIYCIAATIALSCQKQLSSDKIYGEPVASEANLAERVYSLKNTGVYSDTCSIAKAGYGIVLNGNSILERMNYSNWKTTWINKSYPILNRAIGGTTWNEKIGYIKDLTSCYTPNDIVLYDGENEFLRASAGDATVATKLLAAFNRSVDSMRKANPLARMYIVSMITCPVLYKKGFSSAINKVNEGYIARVNQDAVLYPGKMKFIDIRNMYPRTAVSKFEADSIHIKLSAYDEFYNALKQVLPKPGANAWSAPVEVAGVVDKTISSNMSPVANAGADITIGKSWNYNPWIYGTQSKDPDGWIAAYNWTCIQGTQYSIVTPDASKTRLDNLGIGVYIFRLTVTDNKEAQSTDDVKVTVTK